MTYKNVKTEPDKIEAYNNFPVVYRTFKAIYSIIVKEDMKGFKTFCEVNELSRDHLRRLEKEPRRLLPTNILTLLVKKYGISAHWLITGEGEMISN